MKKIGIWLNKHSPTLIQISIIAGIVGICALVIIYGSQHCIPCELKKIGG